MKHLFALAGAAMSAILLALPGTASAQNRIFVGTVAGSDLDGLARRVADVLAAGDGARWIVENRPGAGGALGFEALKGAPVDGTTLLMAPSGALTLAPHTRGNLKYSMADVAPVSRVAAFDVAYIVSAKVPATTLKAYFDWVKQDSSRAVFATPQFGGIPHMFGIKLGRAAGVPLDNAAYRGGGSQLITDVVGGHVLAASSGVAEWLREHQAGTVRILATSGLQRAPQLPNVPTFQELGYKDLTASIAYLLLAPAATPKTTVDAIATRVAKGLADPKLRDALTSQGFVVDGATPAATVAADLKAEHKLWGDLIKETGFKLPN
ncbi:MAG: tripartite tricarboxylate transporter substrate-binding protein [Rubrivivax sp.]